MPLRVKVVAELEVEAECSNNNNHNHNNNNTAAVRYTFHFIVFKEEINVSSRAPSHPSGFSSNVYHIGNAVLLQVYMYP